MKTRSVQGELHSGVPAIDTTSSSTDTISSTTDDQLTITVGTISWVSVVKTVHLPANFMAIAPVQVKYVKKSAIKDLQVHWILH